MRESRYWIVGLVVLGLILTTQTTLGQAEYLKVPFSAVKSSCYGQIDMSKAKFPLSEVGEGCVNQYWLKENLPSDSEEETTVKEEKGGKTNTPEEKEIVVPLDAVHVLKWRKAKNLSEEQNRDDNKVKVPASWVKPEWLKENRPDIETPATLATKEPALEEVVEVIDTPEELLYFMNEYFTIEIREAESYPPRKFLRVRKGECSDWSLFAAYVLHKNGFKTKQLIYGTGIEESGWGVIKGHVVTVYWIDQKMYYLTILLNDATIYGPFDNTRELLQNEVDRRPNLDQYPTVHALAPYDTDNFAPYLEKK